MAYDGGSPKKTATTKTAAAAAVDADDCPTALLAPADYEVCFLKQFFYHLINFEFCLTLELLFKYKEDKREERRCWPKEDC